MTFLSLYNHDCDGFYEKLLRDNIVERARALCRLSREKGLSALDPASDPLISIGMEVDGRGRVTKNALGVLDLSWQAAEHPEWPGMIRREVDQIRAGIRSAHGVELRYLIWAGMGGSAEDKAMYSALGLLNGDARVYLLDSTDPSKLQAILDDMVRTGRSLDRALRGTLVVGMAMGMTSYEPVINLQKLHLLFKKHRVPSAANFLYMTLPDSLLDQFARPKGYRRVELQPDNDNTTAGRHSGPLSRGSLYPLALSGVDLDAWIRSTVLTDGEIRIAMRLAAFLHANGVQGRDKVALLLPTEWAGAGIWTKQDFEESLGKSEQLGIKIFPGRRGQIRWAVKVEGCHNPDPQPDGTPLAVVSGTMPPSRYMQLVHCVVFGLGYLRSMNFVTQPSVELYKQITNRLHTRARKAGKIERTREWQALTRTPHRAFAPGRITLYYDSLIASGLVAIEELSPARSDASQIFVRAISTLLRSGKIEYGELTFYGDTRYRREGQRLRQLLNEAGENFFGQALGIPADIYEGPAMNHSYHEMIIGHGRCFSTVLLTRRQASIPSLDYRADYHKAQWLATKLALEQRGRAVVALVLPDLSAASLRSLRSFFERARRMLG